MVVGTYDKARNAIYLIYVEIAMSCFVFGVALNILIEELLKIYILMVHSEGKKIDYNNMFFSVLMSVYDNEKPENLQQSLNSICDQSLQSNQVVLVFDGYISNELSAVVDDYNGKLKIDVIRLPCNKGLAGALNEGLRHCLGDIVIRMDSDDISLPNRFERQIKYMTDNPNISVSSAYIEEIDECQNLVGIRELPIEHEEIIKFAKKRNPISHPCSVFRKKDVLNMGGYPLFKKSQDYALWSLMLVNGYKFGNINEVLLKMRTGTAFLKRRGAEYLKYEIELLKYQRRIGFLNYYDYILNIVSRSILRLSPDFIKKALYKTFR